MINGGQVVSRIVGRKEVGVARKGSMKDLHDIGIVLYIDYYQHQCMSYDVILLLRETG